MGDGSIIGEVWTLTADACPQCRAGRTWVSPGGYRVCTSCRRGFESGGRVHEADNPALEQLVGQLGRA